MRGIVFTGDRKLELAEFPDPEPGSDEVVLAMKASGMCGSDLKFYRPAPGEAFKALGLRDSGEPIIAGTSRPGKSSRWAARSIREWPGSVTGRRSITVMAVAPARAVVPAGGRCAKTAR